jgi:hypothetical protein
MQMAVSTPKLADIDKPEGHIAHNTDKNCYQEAGRHIMLPNNGMLTAMQHNAHHQQACASGVRLQGGHM